MNINMSLRGTKEIEIIAVVKKEEINWLFRKFGDKWKHIDYDSWNMFSKWSETSQIKSMRGLNHHGQKGIRISKNDISPKHTKCGQYEEWENTILHRTNAKKKAQNEN